MIGDGYTVSIHPFDSSLVAFDLKDTIIGISNNYGSLVSVFLVGNLPYMYSGEISPDGHTDHHGAWPSDMALADVDGTFTDNTVRYTNTYYTRLSNDRRDDKNDQSYLPSDADVQIGRLDLSNLPAFSQSEETLYKNYFDKLHAFKTGEYNPRKVGIVDDHFTSFSEGFSQNGYRNFGSLVDKDSVMDADVRTTLSTDSVLWTYGTGGGTFTSIGGVFTTAQLASDSLNGTFALVLGSYLADVDVEDNVMRAMLANGSFLTAGWAGRPNWFVHHMGIGKTIGYSTLETQNNDGTDYSPTGFYARMMHVMLLGDPSLKQHYTPNVKNLSSIRNPDKDTVFITWDAAASGVIGYHVYRSTTSETEGFTRITSSPITATYYNDAIIDSVFYYYRIETIELVEATSGSYYESSVGDFTVSDPSAAPLPVTLLSFEAERVNQVVELKWRVADEINFSHYTVEKFNENENKWVALDDVFPQENGHGISNYTLIDHRPSKGRNVYRLKMTDYDATYSYSDLAVVIFDEGYANGDFSIYPTLAYDQVTVSSSFDGFFDSREFVITDMRGVEVQRYTITEGNSQIDISSLANGIYFLQDVNHLGEAKKLVKTD